ncbi:Hypothetical_protein [Hexamita inflata]|uniref:Hypothetical_protein n=1 Tax=Hexamita inflata TaxID=28002 RepID=A0ABP1HE45_9EUKA
MKNLDLFDKIASQTKKLDTNKSQQNDSSIKTFKQLQQAVTPSNISLQFKEIVQFLNSDEFFYHYEDHIAILVASYNILFQTNSFRSLFVASMLYVAISDKCKLSEDFASQIFQTQHYSNLEHQNLCINPFMKYFSQHNLNFPVHVNFYCLIILKLIGEQNFSHFMDYLIKNFDTNAFITLLSKQPEKFEQILKQLSNRPIFVQYLVKKSNKTLTFHLIQFLSSENVDTIIQSVNYSDPDEASLLLATALSGENIQYIDVKKLQNMQNESETLQMISSTIASILDKKGIISLKQFFNAFDKQYFVKSNEQIVNVSVEILQVRKVLIDITSLIQADQVMQLFGKRQKESLVACYKWIRQQIDI